MTRYFFTADWHNNHTFEELNEIMKSKKQHHIIEK